MNLLNGKRKYLLLLPLVFIIFNAVYFRQATVEIKDTLLQEKYTEIVNFVDALTVTVDADVERGREGYETTIEDAVKFIDNLPLVFAAAYTLNDGELVLFPELRNYETNYEPTDYPEFVNAVLTHESGELIMGFTPENQPYRDMHIYYRWMPTISDVQTHYLVVAAVSQYSVTAKVAEWVSVGQIINTIVTFVIILTLIMLLARLGYVYGSRNGDKWRDKGAGDD